MSAPKFAIGDRVRLETRARLRIASNATYDVVSVHIDGDSEAVYRLQAPDEPFARVAHEHELTFEERPEEDGPAIPSEPFKKGRINLPK